jgi:hypothetical protein
MYMYMYVKKYLYLMTHLYIIYAASNGILHPIPAQVVDVLVPGFVSFSLPIAAYVPRLYHNKQITSWALKTFDVMGPHQEFIYMLLTFKLLTLKYFFVHAAVLSIKTAFNLVKIHLLFLIIPLIQWSVMFCRPCLNPIVKVLFSFGGRTK